MKDIHLIYNPISGKGSTRKAYNKIKTWAQTQQDLNLIVHKTDNVGHATSLARDISSAGKPVTILVLGGDGSLNEVLNGIDSFENTTMGILPFGSGNDFVKSLKMKCFDPVELMESYVNNPKVMKIDYLVLNDKYRAINEIGLGMSAEVIALRNKIKHFKPETQYKLATIIRALFWKSFDYTISADKGPQQNIKSMWFTINNGNCIGSGMVTDPDAKNNDGLISISYVKKFPRIITLGLLAKCKKGKIAKIKHNVRFTCKEIDLVAKDVVVEFDGNLIEHQSNINVKIIPGKLNLLVPPR